VIERDGRFLLVEEETDDGLRFNQPAGHLDEGESLLAACAREALEETAWNFAPTALVGVYQWPRPQGDITYLRFAFCGELGAHEAGPARRRHPARGLDDAGRNSRQRGPPPQPAGLAMRRDWLAGRRFPLDLIRHYD
jgi:8-oxo-dGTP pyrophosphatase MutT (NUDIX family)